MDRVFNLTWANLGYSLLVDVLIYSKDSNEYTTQLDKCRKAWGTLQALRVH